MKANQRRSRKPKASPKSAAPAPPAFTRSVACTCKTWCRGIEPYAPGVHCRLKGGESLS